MDVFEFTTRLEFARQHPHSPPAKLCAGCQPGLAEAAALYTADFMAGFSVPGSREFEDWQFFESETLRQSFAETLQTLIEWHAAREESEAAIRYARRWLALDALHEPAHRALMTLYAGAGQQAAALRQYQECVRLLQDELGVEPEDETAALYDDIRARRLTKLAGAAQSGGEAPSRPGFVRSNLPLRSAPLVGREVELAHIIACLRDQPDCRLLTLVGPGGIGKTSLAMEAAARLIDDPDCPFCDGVYFVPLAALSRVDSIIEAIAAALQLPLVVDPEERPRQLLNFLQPKRLLLVLDNFEHLISPESIRLVVDLLAFSPQVKLLATSRARLNAHLEHLFPLKNLEVPQTGTGWQSSPVAQTVSAYSAIQLFALRAQGVKPDFELTASSLEAVIQICKLVHGLPLGIELAAAWLEVLSEAEIAAEVESSLDFLAASWPDRPERHHSLRAMFDSSWRLLADPERGALMTLTLFQGSFTRHAAQAVSGASLSLLLALQNKSWLQHTDQGRYQIHELLRQYTAEQLQADPPAMALARERFAAYYAGFMAGLGEDIRGPAQNRALETIAAEFESIRLAWQILVETGKVALAVEKMVLPLVLYAEMRIKYYAIKPLLDLAEAEAASEPWITADPDLLVILLSIKVIFSPYGDARYHVSLTMKNQEGLVRRAWELTAGGLEMLQRLGYWGALISYLANLLDLPGSSGRLGELSVYFRENNRRWELAKALDFSAILAMYTGSSGSWGSRDFTAQSATAQADARRFLEEAWTIFRELGDPHHEIMTMQVLGELKSEQGDYQEAMEIYQALLVEGEKVGNAFLAIGMLYGLVNIYAMMGEYASSFHYAHTLQQKFAAIGEKTMVAHALSSESLMALRFDTLEHARQTRLESLALYQEVASAHGAAWANWEMGDIERFAGNLGAARAWFEKSRALFEHLDERTLSGLLPARPGGACSPVGRLSRGAGPFPGQPIAGARIRSHLGAALCPVWFGPGGGRLGPGCRGTRAFIASFSLVAGLRRGFAHPLPGWLGRAVCVHWRS